jgi:DNA-binding transcriptional LysR family regulator
MNVSYRQLRAFALVARLGNFSRAAERLHITQSGLSAMMRELEANLKCRLFDRTTRAVRLTPAGEQLLPAASTVVEQLDLVAAQISDIGTRAKRSLRIAATPLVSSSLLPVVCRQLRAEHPDLNIQLVDCDINRARSLVENGEVDFGLGFFFRSAKGIERSPLCTFRLMRVSLQTGGQHDAGHSLGTASWQELKDVELIGLPSDNPIQQLVETHLRKVRPGSEERATFNQFDTLIAMVAAGMGTAVIPTFALLACRRYPVRCDVLANPSVPLGFYRITRKGREHAPLMDEFTDALVSLLHGLEEGVPT